MKRVLQMATPATLLIAALSVAASASGAAAATVTVNSFISGFYQSTGGTPTQGVPSLIEDGTRNNYLAFDLSGISGKVTGATLTILGNNGNFSFNTTTPAVVTYSIYDVKTDVGALIDYSKKANAFTDLGSGTVYGSTSITKTATTFGAMPQLVIDLSGGLTDINAALGALFALGGSSNLEGNQGFLWISSTFNPAAQLTLQVDPVPLPAALPLFATILGGGGLIAWRRRRKQLRAAA